MKQRLIKDLLSYFLFNPPWFIRLDHKLSDEKVLKKGCIIDIETTGLYPSEDNVLTLGILKGNHIHIYQLVKPQYPQFLSLVRRIVEKEPTPRYAYFAHFEQNFLNLPSGWHCLGRYGPSRWHLEEEVRYSLIDVTHSPYNDPKDRDIDGYQVPTRWGEWLYFKNPKILAEIPYHCLCDLLRERQLI